MDCGGLDIGGTKIEARLFDAGLGTIDTRRVPTPRDSADGFFAALGGLVGWLRDRSGTDLPIGIAMSGVVEPDSGIARTANLPISGENMAARLTEVAGRPLPVMNDSMALAFSEANGGAADGHAAAVGMIIGTGFAAGVCLDGRPARRPGGIAVEIGHCGMPARALARHGLDLWTCGCGRPGCIEAYVAGPGLTRLAAHMGLGKITAPELAARAHEAAAEAVLAVWADLAAEALETLQMTIDPEIVVLGGGVSQMPGVVERLQAALPARLMPGTPLPILRLARHGDASGVRGAALLARMTAQGEMPWRP
ncbi:ROK family protein [Paracoccus sp. MC1862]|uniref:ROK family protein n=1 Tax=Paracoccus sp. MC1862 TaxID=2760307 RepID=UPI001603EB72|nr:ROK family protein [Paracoccus sp. MC1862]MBB1497978.1 ROK family protein [Paracoccus sp. MC1862]QQO44362.1 ROK family protein [Paracoccus sp. MC1862]